MDNNNVLSEIDELIKQGDLSKASALCQQQDELAVNQEEISLRRASIAHLQQNTHKAISHLCDALKHNAGSLIALQNLAVFYEQVGDLENAKKCYENVYQLSPQSHDSLKNLAFFLYDNAYAKEARQTLQRLIIESPFNAVAHFAYSRTGTYTRDDITLKFIQDGASQLSKSSPMDKVKYAFTVAKINHDIGEYEAAFKAYQQANNLYAMHHPDSLDGDLKLLDDVKAQFGSDSPWPLETWQQPHSKEHPTPLFIVGMPRTGSTLLEQLIGAHSQIEAAGETNYLFKAIEKHLIADHKTLASAAPHWTSKNFSDTAADYLAKISSINKDAAYVIDKMPGNFAFIGIIHRLFPNAKVIVTRRSAMDVIWSNYSTLFGEGLLLYTYKLETLAKYYVAQEHTIDYWQKLLPESALKISTHESLVEQTKSNVEALLAYLDLPWQDNCLNVQDSKSLVKTASHLQVKQAINTSGFNRWKHYSQQLEQTESHLISAGIAVS